MQFSNGAKMKKSLLISISILLCSFSLAAQTSTLAELAGTAKNTKKISNEDAASIISTSTAVESLASRVQIAMSNSDYMVTAGDIYGLAFIVGSSPMEYKIIEKQTSFWKGNICSAILTVISRDNVIFNS